MKGVTKKNLIFDKRFVSAYIIICILVEGLAAIAGSLIGSDTTVIELSIWAALCAFSAFLVLKFDTKRMDAIRALCLVFAVAVSVGFILLHLGQAVTGLGAYALNMLAVLVVLMLVCTADTAVSCFGLFLVVGATTWRLPRAGKMFVVRFSLLIVLIGFAQTVAAFCFYPMMQLMPKASSLISSISLLFDMFLTCIPLIYCMRSYLLPVDAAVMAQKETDMKNLMFSKRFVAAYILLCMVILALLGASVWRIGGNTALIDISLWIALCAFSATLVLKFDKKPLRGKDLVSLGCVLVIVVLLILLISKQFTLEFAAHSLGMPETFLLGIFSYVLKPYICCFGFFLAIFALVRRLPRTGKKFVIRFSLLAVLMPFVGMVAGFVLVPILLLIPETFFLPLPIEPLVRNLLLAIPLIYCVCSYLLPAAEEGNNDESGGATTTYSMQSEVHAPDCTALKKTSKTCDV